MTKNTILKSDEFTIWQPGAVEVIEKGEKSSDTSRRIGGYCSTEALDRQNEVVLQKGLDFAEFVNYGYFNDNHKQGTADVVGVPEKAEFHPGKGWYTEGYLLKGFPKADEIWNLAKALKDTHRRLGFSIEGKVLERRDNFVVKARIRHVAITNCPVNPTCTWEALSKSFHPEMADPDSAVSKALAVGYARPADSGGRILTGESLEKDEVRDVYPCEACEKVFRSEAGFTKHVNTVHVGKSLAPEAVSIFRKSRAYDEDEAVQLLRKLRPEYSEAICRRIFNFAAKKGA